jgi:hypothetical protein
METFKEIISTWYGLLITAIVLTALISAFLDFVNKVYYNTLSFIVLVKNGYPPEHCDADGKLKQDKK